MNRFTVCASPRAAVHPLALSTVLFCKLLHCSSVISNGIMFGCMEKFPPEAEIFYIWFYANYDQQALWLLHIVVSKHYTRHLNYHMSKEILLQIFMQIQFCLIVFYDNDDCGNGLPWQEWLSNSFVWRSADSQQATCLLGAPCSWWVVIQN